MTYVLGVDGGNTKTIALVARLDGAIVGVGRGRWGDIYGAPTEEAALGEIDHAVREALRQAGVHERELRAGVFSMAGADWPEDFDLLHAAMTERGFGERIAVFNDALGGLRAGTLDGLGVVVACGTGAALAARGPDGRMWHMSFWQEPHGGHDLGNKMLRAVYRAELGIDPPTTLTERVLRHFELPTVEAVLHLMTRRGERPHGTRVAQLARPLLDEAERGDATARQIVVTHGTMLGDYALACARKVGIEGTPFTLVLTGGVLRHPSRLLGDALVARVRTTSPDVQVVNSRFEPAIGAVLLALEAADVVIDEPLLARLIPTLPPAATFET
jgi:N-acetylglucosamine kinase-like BadF-type ATPase